jgi:hydrophobic/amphiphilic exporter-1 (mainly G- bacteria), HAE1 family
MRFDRFSAAGNHRNISAWAIRNPILVGVLFLLLTLAGLLAFPTLRINNTPDLDLPAVVISVAQPGAGPSEIEALVTRRIEDAVAGLADIRHITSTVSDGASTTVVEFVLGRNIDSAVNDIRDKVAEVRADLPAGLREPVVTHVEAAGGAILTYTVAATERDEKQLSRLVDDTITRSLLLIPGVAQVDRLGGVDSEIRVALRPDRLLALGVTASDVNGQLRDLNLNLPGGRGMVGGVEQTIRTLGSVASVEQLRLRSIALPGGRTARLGDLAEVADGTAEIRGSALLDGRKVLAFTVMRTRASSEVAVADQVAAAIARIEAADPALRIALVANTVDFSRDGFRAAIEALLIGAALAVLVVWAFLRDWRATFVASVAIPLSLIPTFLVMKLLGFSLNNVTLLGLTLVIGVLVDDAIVEIENIVRHLRARPQDGAYVAALDGSAEIGFAVIATTAAILAVFVPVAFMPGIPGQFFRQFGLTVAAAVAFSLLVARLLTPLLSAYLLKPGQPQRRGRADGGRMQRWYIGVLRACLRHRLVTIGGGILFFAASVALVPFIPHDFVPAGDRDRAALSIELAPGSTLADTEAVTREATRILKARPEVVSVFAAVGAASSGSVEGAALGNIRKAGDPQAANLTVKLLPRAERSLSQQEFENAIRPELERLAGARVHFAADKRGGSRLQITLVGDDPAALAGAARDLERQMRGIPRLSGARSTASLMRPELRIIPRDERAAERGVSVADIGATARLATVGDVDQSLARFDLADRQIPIRVMLEEHARGDLDTLRSLQVSGRDGLVPLDAVAEIRYGAGPAQINHLDRLRKMTVEAELNGLPLGEAVRAVGELPIMRTLPAGVREQEVGDKETMRETLHGFALTLGAGVLLVYLVLVVLFGGFIQPITIMSALPLSLGGAMLALLMAQKSLGIAAIVGLLMLMGIVAKNSILLVESAIAARSLRGLSRSEAIIEAAQKRGKPIVMTTVAMCAGMLHVACGFGADAEFRSPMALVVIGGLITSTVLSLVFVPAAYTYMDQFEGWLAGRFGLRSARPAEAHAMTTGVRQESERALPVA